MIKLNTAPLGILSIGVILIGLAAGGATFTSLHSCPAFTKEQVKINETTFEVGLATTPYDQTKGLGGCKAVPEKAGLLFPYSPPQNVAFWMHGMVIPIDIVWISENKVIGVEENIQPPSDPASKDLPNFSPPAPVTNVLEIKAGGVQEYGIETGDTVQIDDI